MKLVISLKLLIKEIGLKIELEIIIVCVWELGRYINLKIKEIIKN